MNVNGVMLEKIAEKDEYVTYNLFFGPNHPGMHGNFAYILDVVGTRIAKVRPNPGLLHRGFEKLMEQKKWFQNVALIPRICVPDPDPNEVAYCTSVEKIAGIEIPERAKYLRTITLEMSRLTSFLMGVGALAAMMGLYTAMYRMMTERDRLLDLFEWLTGARVYHIYNVPGGVRRDVPSGWFDKLLEVLDYIESCFDEYDKLVWQNPVILKRLDGIGPLTPEQAVNWGITGPSLRATGFAADIRKDDSYAAYPFLDFEIETTQGGEGIARALQIRKEFAQSIDLIRQAISKIPLGPVKEKVGNPLKFRVPKGEAYTRIESSKGEFGYYVVSDGGLKPYRVAVRGPSFAGGLYVCQEHLPGMKIDDLPVWMASLAICPPDIDR